MQDLLDYSVLSATYETDQMATKYISTERLWHNNEEPRNEAWVLVRFVERLCAAEKFAVCQYNADAELYTNEHGCYKHKHVQEWCYIDELK